MFVEERLSKSEQSESVLEVCLKCNIVVVGEQVCCQQTVVECSDYRQTPGCDTGQKQVRRHARFHALKIRPSLELTFMVSFRL